jgi:hypothetical protein
MNHFTDLELQRWAKNGPGEDAGRLTEHLAACEECSRRYAQAIRTQPLPEEEAPRDVREFVDAGHRVAHPRPRWMWPAAIAAAILIAIVVAPMLLRNQPSENDELRLRGTAVQAVSPSGVVSSPNFEFKWASGVQAAGYRVEIGRGEKTIAFVDTRESHLAAPPTLPAGDYWWQVSALDEAHRPITTSQRVAFTLRF